MTSRESKIEDNVHVVGAPNYKRWLDLSQGDLILFCFELELGNC